MQVENVLEKTRKAMADVNFDETLSLCKEAMAHGLSPAKVVEALSEGLRVVGERFEVGEYFLSELIMAGEIMKEAMQILRPHFKSEQIKVCGRVVMGTVEGDLHDIGKNIATSLLLGAGFEVIDLGVNVPAEKFVQVVREAQPEVLGLSALLTTTVPEMGNVIEALEGAGIRQKVKVVVGGLPLNLEYARKLGADYYAENALKGVEIIKKAVMKN